MSHKRHSALIIVFLKMKVFRLFHAIGLISTFTGAELGRHVYSLSLLWVNLYGPGIEDSCVQMRHRRGTDGAHRVLMTMMRSIIFNGFDDGPPTIGK